MKPGDRVAIASPGPLNNATGYLHRLSPDNEWWLVKPDPPLRGIRHIRPENLTPIGPTP